MIHLSSNTRITFKAFLPVNYTLDLHTLAQQQSQDTLLKTRYHLLSHNNKPEQLTPQITGTPFLNACYKIFSQLL